MRKECPRAADSFLLAIGELSFFAGLRAFGHTLVCRECRVESKALRKSALSIASTVGSSTVKVVPLKVATVKLAAAAISAITVAGLWYAGREAVGAAMASAERPRLRQTSYQNDEPPPMPSKRAND